MQRAEMERLFLLRREKTIREARTSFWKFCQLIAPDFYIDGRWHLQKLCVVLQALYEGTLQKENKEIYKRLMINMPPRMGKSRTLILFCMWCLGRDKANKIITCSYNDDLATDFSRYTRDGINESKTFPHEVIYADIFPASQIKQGNASYHQWALEGQFFSYKGAGVGGSITGKGCNISVVDDPVKDAFTAFSDTQLDKIWTWYTGTFLSRAEEGAIEILNMTRWSSKDICGRILAGEEADEWYVLKFEAMQDGNMLCPELLSEKSYISKQRNIDKAIFRANYHQEPVDLQNALYQGFQTYTDEPRSAEGKPLYERVISYGDTADEGADYLCNIIVGVYKGLGYVLDVYYTKKPMETTEPETADRIVIHNVSWPVIESNNGGRGFARNIERQIWERHQNRSVRVDWFHQSRNKRSRIMTNNTNVINMLRFPVDWATRWPEYYAAMATYQREGKNENDDAPDATTGIVELMTNNIKTAKGPITVAGI